MSVPREDRWILGWLAACFAAAAAMIAYNALQTRYVGVSYLPRLFSPLPVAAAMGLWIAYAAQGRTREAELCADLSLYAMAMVAMAALTTGAQYAPFAPVDAALARADAALGWNGPAVAAWTAAHPVLRAALERCYFSTDLQLALAPLAATLAPDRRRRRVLIHAFVYTLLAGTLFYYFFPSSGPAGYYGGSGYAPLQFWTARKFALVHARRPGATVDGGLIAFPSFHVAWSALVVDASRGDRRALIPALLLNAAVIASTVLLGWHFLVDAFGGLALAAAGVAAGEWAHRRLR